MSEDRNLWQRINAVRKSNEYIKKAKTVEGQGYKAVTHDQVTAELRNDLIANGVLIYPSIVAGTHRVVDTGTKTKSGIPFIRLEADVTVTFVNVDKPTERIDTVLPAHAIDQGDKAPGKLLSYAVKYAMLKMFSIETGEDDESRHVERDGEDVMSEKEVRDWQVAVDAVGTVEEAERLWKDRMLPRLREVNDKAAYTKLHAYVEVRLGRIRKLAAEKAAREKSEAKRA